MTNRKQKQMPSQNWETQLKFLEDRHFLAMLPDPSAALEATDTFPASLLVYYHDKSYKLNLHVALWTFQGWLIV